MTNVLKNNEVIAYTSNGNEHLFDPDKNTEEALESAYHNIISP